MLCCIVHRVSSKGSNQQNYKASSGKVKGASETFFGLENTDLLLQHLELSLSMDYSSSFSRFRTFSISVRYPQKQDYIASHEENLVVVK